MKGNEKLFKIILIVLAIFLILVGMVSCGEKGGTFEITNYSLIEINININHEDYDDWFFAKFIKHGETVNVYAPLDGNYIIRVFPRNSGDGNVRVNPESATLSNGSIVKVSIFNR